MAAAMPAPRAPPAAASLPVDAGGPGAHHRSAESGGLPAPRELPIVPARARAGVRDALADRRNTMTSSTSNHSAPRERGGARDPVLFAALLLGLAARGAFVVLYPVFTIWNDESLHYVTSVIAANVEQPILGHWPPLYDFTLAGIFRVFGPDLVAARWVQVLYSTATIGLVYGIAREMAGRRAARIAAFVCALYPSLVAFTHYVYSETLFAALLTAGFYVLVRSRERGTLAHLGAAGFLFGLAALTRSAALYFLPGWLLWLVLLRRPAEAKRAAVVLGFALLTIAPWTLRNALVMDAFVPIDTAMGRTAWWAYNDGVFAVDLGYSRDEAFKNRPHCAIQVDPRKTPLPDWETLRALFPPDDELDARTVGRLRREIERVRREATMDRLAYSSCESDAALAFVRENPLKSIGRMVQRVYFFWGPNSFLLRSVHWESYPGGPLGRSAYPAVKTAVVGSYVVVVAMALLALGRRSRGAGAEMIVLYAAYATALHAAAVASSRYRLPMMPLLIVLAAIWLAEPRLPEGWARRYAVWSGLVAFAVLSAAYVATVLP
jgi:4-amino-4-deoxy-L-arabinose transferase-like glycosyltransferase